jgi:hypothetical protein
MSTQSVNVLGVVALLVDVPSHGLLRGQVGTIVEQLAADVFEVEFNDDEGSTYAALAIEADSLLVLHHSPVQAA